MKKLAALIALALCVTIGGVYATWNYAQGSVASQSKYITATITDKVVDAASGTIAIDASEFKITIDDSNNDHVAEVTYSGSIKVTFTPTPGADADIVNNGIKLQYALSVTADWKFEGTAFFTVNTTTQQLNGGNATKEVVIQATELESLIYFGSFSLPTVEKYNSFQQLLKTGSIGITVSEVE